MIANAPMVMTTPAIEATTGTTQFLFFLHEIDAHRFGFPPTLEVIKIYFNTKT